jgi:uncharacterized protein YecE (DUF72 family)
MKKQPSGNISIGISGWRYPPWRGVFYPPGLPQRRELEYSSRQFNTIEINGSFYSLQRPENYAAWYESTPDDFVFSVKGGRYITHILRLKGVERALAISSPPAFSTFGKNWGPFSGNFPRTSIIARTCSKTFSSFCPLTPRRPSLSRENARVA